MEFLYFSLQKYELKMKRQNKTMRIIQRRIREPPLIHSNFNFRKLQLRQVIRLSDRFRIEVN